MISDLPLIRQEAIPIQKLAYIALGGNIGDSVAVLCKAIQMLMSHAATRFCRLSAFYATTPVSTIAQGDYVNAVCALSTTLAPRPLLHLLQAIERALGKTAKDREAPRIADLDLLFYGSAYYHDSELTLPHPRWHQRLFVLHPLRQLTRYAPVAVSEKLLWLDLDQLLATFSNAHNEVVIPLKLR